MCWFRSSVEKTQGSECWQPAGIWGGRICIRFYKVYVLKFCCVSILLVGFVVFFCRFLHQSHRAHLEIPHNICLVRSQYGSWMPSQILTVPTQAPIVVLVLYKMIILYLASTFWLHWNSFDHFTQFQVWVCKYRIDQNILAAQFDIYNVRDSYWLPYWQTEIHQKCFHSLTVIQWAIFYEK